MSIQFHCDVPTGTVPGSVSQSGGRSDLFIRGDSGIAYMVYSLVVASDLQGWCGDYSGSAGGIEQQTMVGSTGKGVGSHGFGCYPSGGGSASVDSVVDVRSGCELWV